jgi:hypothetical protein
MKRTHRVTTLIAALLTAGTLGLAAGSAFACPGGGGEHEHEHMGMHMGGGGPGWGEGPRMGMGPQEMTPEMAERMHEHMREHMQQRVDRLGDRLEIKASQQPAWQAYVKAHQSMADNLPKPPAPDADAATLMRHRADGAALMAKKLGDMADATAKLQQALTPEQNKLFADLVRRHMGAGRPGMMPGMGMPGMGMPGGKMQGMR